MPSSNKPKLKLPEILLLIIATVGLFDATLLTVQHYADLKLPCSVTHGCATVLTSKYAVVLGLPVAAYGILFYLVVLMMSFYAYQNATDRKWLLILSSLGFLSTLYLIYLQAFVIHAWCQYCLLSAVSSTLLFVVSAILFINQRKGKKLDDGKQT